jgi:hypothetical protein
LCSYANSKVVEIGIVINPMYKEDAVMSRSNSNADVFENFTKRFKAK